MNIKEITRIVNLIKKVNCEEYAFVSETAKEIGVKKTQLMQFIEDNPYLFKLGEPAEKGRTRGLAILRTYERTEDNPESDEWLENRKNDWKKTILTRNRTYYGQYQFTYIEPDMPGSEHKAHLWRNTPEKIKELEETGLIRKSETTYGGLGDTCRWKGYVINSEDISRIRQAGWTIVQSNNEN